MLLALGVFILGACGPLGADGIVGLGTFGIVVDLPGPCGLTWVPTAANCLNMADNLEEALRFSIASFTRVVRSIGGIPFAFRFILKR